MRVTVTGASGNVGSALLRALAEWTDVEVTALARRPPPGPPGPRVRWVAADVAQADLRAVFEGADAVVHLAWLLQPARRPQVLHRANVVGSRRVFDAAVAAGVGTLVHASSVGVYSPGPKDGLVAESWPRQGIPTSSYSRDKVAVETMLDEVEEAHPAVRVVRLRPGLIFQRDAATEIARYFLGPLAPIRLLPATPVVPLPDQLRFQAVHSDDVAAAYVAVLLRQVRGAFNIAAEPVLDRARIATALQARPIAVPAGLLRAVAAASHQLRLQPTDAGWVDLATASPLMDTGRARRELQWQPRWDATEALLDLLAGLRAAARGRSPVLAHRVRSRPR